MVRVLLLSDTHGYIDNAILKHVDAADEVWHAGDLGSVEVAETLASRRPLRAVYGNIDGPQLRMRFPEDLVFNCGGARIFMTHIAGLPHNYPARIKALIGEHRPNALVCGHSHILKVEYSKTYNLVHLNPGACGHQGFHTMRTVLRFEISGGELKNLAVIELGKRGSAAGA